MAVRVVIATPDVYGQAPGKRRVHDEPSVSGSRLRISPEPGDEPPAHAVHVATVSGEVALKDGFLAEDSRDDHGNEQQGGHDRPP